MRTINLNDPRVEEPERFEREWQTIKQFRAEMDTGSALGYGLNCAAYFSKLISEL